MNKQLNFIEEDVNSVSVKIENLLKKFEAFYSNINETKDISNLLTQLDAQINPDCDINVYEILSNNITNGNLLETSNALFKYFEEYEKISINEVYTKLTQAYSRKDKRIPYDDGSFYYGLIDSELKRYGKGLYHGANKDVFYGEFKDDFYHKGIFCKYNSDSSKRSLYNGEFEVNVKDQNYKFKGIYVPDEFINIKNSYFLFIGTIDFNSQIYDGAFFSKINNSSTQIYHGRLIKGIKECDKSYIITKKDNLVEISIGSFNSDKFEGHIVFNNYYLCDIVKSGNFTSQIYKAYYYITPEKDIYAGLIKDNKFTDKGILAYQNTDYYIGEFEKGIKSGLGKLKQTTINNENVNCKVYFSGSFKFDKMACGILYSNGKKVFEGTFNDDETLKEGEYYYPDGTSYIGKFLDNKRNGMGKYIYSDNTYFEGFYELDKKTGEGVLNKNGRVFKGVWKDDKNECLVEVNLLN
jgi:hypothetical protein